MKPLHKIQLEILKKLLFVDKLRYTSLKPMRKMENNQFDFHLKELIKSGYIAKNQQYYSLTGTGKEFANRMDTDKVTISQQAKISAWFCCRRKKGKEYDYLIYTRLKQPFYGCQGFPSGKVQYGEMVINAAKRELYEETQLIGTPQIVAIKHYLVFDKILKNLLEDKFMFFCLIANPKGTLKPNNEGRYEWVSQTNLQKHITKPFENYSAFKKQLDLINNYDGRPVFIEENHFSYKF